MTRPILAALLFSQVFGMVTLAAPVPKHLFPKPEPEPTIVKTSVAAPVTQTTDAQEARLKGEALIQAKLAEILAEKQARAAGTYVPKPIAPGTVILQTGPVQLAPPPADPK
jgi:hypothetical protein